MTSKLEPKVLAVTFTLVILVLDITGYIWHGALNQPSIMNLLYPGFWSNTTLLALGLIGSLIGAYLFGYIFATIYNWSNKKVN